jgi:hypothetical protein
MQYTPLFIKDKKTKDGTISTLKNIRKLLSKPEKWIKGDLSSYDEEKDLHSYCLIGAAQEKNGSFQKYAIAAMIDSLSAQYKPIINFANEESYDEVASFMNNFDHKVMEFNDEGNRRHRDILALIDRAIKKVSSVKLSKAKVKR